MSKLGIDQDIERASPGTLPQFVLLGGEELPHFTPTPEVFAFLERVSLALEDLRINEQDMVRLVWGVQNPLLDSKTLRGRALATEETYRNPAFRLMLDLLARKRMRIGSLDIEKASARYTMTVPEAAQALGIHQTSVRHAIKEGRLAAWKRTGAYYLDPVTVRSYRVSSRGARATWKNPLTVRFGTNGDRFLNIRWNAAGGEAAPDLANRVNLADGTTEGVVPAWQSAAVFTGIKSTGSYRCFQLTPRQADVELTDEVEFLGFYVRGHFTANKINNPKEAVAAWEAFGRL